MCDHIKTNGLKNKFGRFWFEKPPEFPDKEEIELFTPGKTDWIEKKLTDLMVRLDKVEKKYKQRIKEINRAVVYENLDKDSEYFCLMFAEIKYSEIIYINKWLEYWLKIYEIASKKQVLFKPKYEEQQELGVSQEEIKRAKDKPIEELFDGDLKNMGNRFLACCPFHGEKTPSFTIFTEDNHFYCFGCHISGDAIDFIMKKKNINLIEAVKELNRG